MAKQDHIIMSQEFDLILDEGLDSFQLQQDVIFIFQQKVLPRLELLFDQLVDEHTVLQIDTLEIDLGHIEPEHFEIAFAEQMLLLTEQALREQLAQATPVEQETFRQMSAPQATLEKLIFFLEHGYLPWWGQNQAEVDWEAQLIEAIGKEPRRTDRLFTLLSTQPQALQRLLWQFSEALWEALVSARHPQLRRGLLNLRQVWPEIVHSLDRPQIFPEPVRHIFWRAVLQLASEVRDAKVFLPRLIQHLFQHLHTQAQLSIARLTALSLRVWAEVAPSSRPAGIQLWQQILLEEWPALQPLVLDPLLSESAYPVSLQKLQKGRIEPRKPKEESSLSQTEISAEEKEMEAAAQANEQEAAKASTEAAESQQQAPDLQEASKAAAEDSAIFITHAGVIMCHPFLTALLTKLGLVEGQDFVDEDARVRAVYVIQYLAAGEFEVAEYQLALNKLLCGMPLSQPIPGEIQLTEAEKAEADHLLEVMIGHWGALKQSTPDGLRYNFFMREGKLSHGENGWKLIVEQQTQDVLLGKLPWGLSMVKLPWMPDILRVDWG